MSHSPHESIEANTPAVDAPTSLEQQLRQAQKMEVVGRLAGGVAHDFNNLLTVINGCSELLLHLVADQQKATRLVQDILGAGQRAAVLTRQLLAFSRKQVWQPRILDLNSLVVNFESMLRRLIGEEVELVTRLHPGSLAVKADPGQLEQVLMNLVVNARDAMPQGGKVTVTTERISTNSESSGVRLSVSDTGIGMDEHVMAHLFEPFFTTKEQGKGTGLGLSTVYGIVQDSGGKITVTSKPGQGATFTIELPLQNPARLKDSSPSRPRLSLPGKGIVLLIEDEDAVRNLVRQQLESTGYRVLTARHGIEALSRCERYQKTIDLVITDVVMPFLGGVELVQRLRQRYPNIKALYMSGFNESKVLRNGVQNLELTYLSKPFTGSQLIEAVCAILEPGSDDPSACRSHEKQTPI